MTELSTIRTIHHLSCTGGTMISKCIAVCGDPLLVSEVTPAGRATALRFAPLDIIGQLQAQYRCLAPEDRREHFRAQIALAMKIAARQGRPLCLRDHAHTDYLLGPFAGGSSLRRAIDDLGVARFSLATMRHPLDSYIAMQLRGWGKASDRLDEYAGRVTRFVQDCEADGVEILRYEDFCTAPDDVLRRMCSLLDLPFNPEFRSLFGAIKLTGDSGRGSSVISLRPRRPVEPELAAQAAAAETYRALCHRLGYDPADDAPALATAPGPRQGAGTRL